MREGLVPVMKRLLFYLSTFLILSFVSAQEPVKVILDTDLGYDVDDVGALAVLHALTDSGEAEILAVVSEVADPYAPAAIDVVNTYYGRPDIIVGQNSRRMWLQAFPYWTRQKAYFTRELAASFPYELPSIVPSAVQTYRKVLSEQPDGSVNVIVIGFLQNLSDLLDSPPDRYSPLTGLELVKLKANQIAIMGGSYPRSERDFNTTGGPENSTAATRNVLENWPTEIVLTPGSVCGGKVNNGRTLSKTTPSTSPVRAAYELFNGRPNAGRTSWDLCTVLYGVRYEQHDGKRYFSLVKSGTLEVKADKSSAWTSTEGPHKRLKRSMGVDELVSVLEQLLSAPPGLSSAP